MTKVHARVLLFVGSLGVTAALFLTPHAATETAPPTSTGTPVIDQHGNQGFWFHANQLGTPIFAHEHGDGGTVVVFQSKGGTLTRVILDEKGARLTHTLTPFGAK